MGWRSATATVEAVADGLLGLGTSPRDRIERERRRVVLQANFGIFLESTMEEPAIGPFLDGMAAVFSTRAPAKDGPNEDAAALLRYDDRSGVLVVCDGVGGSPAGRHASRLGIEEMDAHLRFAAEGQGSLRDAVLNGIESANRSVLDLGQGAATTMAVVEMQGNAMRPYHVGDSAILVVGQRGRVRLQTISHSPVGYAVESGLLDEDEAVHHEHRHVVSNVIGSADMRIEVGSSFELARRDTVLLASDGLFDNFYIDEIVALIRKGDLPSVAGSLIEQTRSRMMTHEEKRPGKPDDVTFILYRPNGS